MTLQGFIDECTAIYAASGAAISTADWTKFNQGAERYVARRARCLRGDITTSVAITEAGDVGDALSAWSITGATYANTDDGVAYWKLKRDGDDAIVSVYADSAEATTLCAGTADVNGQDATITLAEIDSSGVTGTVVCADGASADETTSANTLTFENSEMLVTNGNRIVEVTEVYWNDDSAGTTQRLYQQTEEWLRQRYGGNWRDTPASNPSYYYLLQQAAGTYICPWPKLSVFDDTITLEGFLLPTPLTQTTDTSEMPELSWEAVIFEMCYRAAMSDENYEAAAAWASAREAELRRIRGELARRAETRGIRIAKDTDGPSTPIWYVRVVDS